jgi:hypothetical protein
MSGAESIGRSSPEPKRAGTASLFTITCQRRRLGPVLLAEHQHYRTGCR